MEVGDSFTPQLLYPRRKIQGTNSTGDWVDPRVDLDILENR